MAQRQRTRFGSGGSPVRSGPSRPSASAHAGEAQMEERLLGTQEAAGSTPAAGSPKTPPAGGGAPGPRSSDGQSSRLLRGRPEVRLLSRAPWRANRTGAPGPAATGCVPHQGMSFDCSALRRGCVSGTAPGAGLNPDGAPRSGDRHLTHPPMEHEPAGPAGARPKRDGAARRGDRALRVPLREGEPDRCAGPRRRRVRRFGGGVRVVRLPPPAPSSSGQDAGLSSS